MVFPGQESLQNLRSSGLSDETILAAEIVEFDSPGSPGQGPQSFDLPAYVIPYFDVQGARLDDFFRIRPIHTRPDAPKYLQPTGTDTHIYFPSSKILSSRSLHGWQSDPQVPLQIVEGEKKALAALQCEQLPVTIGLGGVDNWHSRLLRFKFSGMSNQRFNHKGQPANLGQYGEIRLTYEQEEKWREKVSDDLYTIEWDSRPVVLVYDSDYHTNQNVQRAAFDLALWLEWRGAEVSVVVIPPQLALDKAGLDDYLMIHGPKAFLMLVERTAFFPERPNIKMWVARKLETSGHRRDTQTQVTRAITASLDKRGRRYRSKDPMSPFYYYFEYATKAMHEFEWDPKSIRHTSMGSLLTNEFGLSTVDSGAFGRLGEDYIHRRGIEEVTPSRVSRVVDDTLYIQLSDSQMAKVSEEGIEFVDNGTDNVVFLTDSVAPTEVGPIQEILSGKYEMSVDASRKRYISPPPSSFPSYDPQALAGRRVTDSYQMEGFDRDSDRWHQALQRVNVQPFEGLGREESLTILSSLFHVSPWLWRWRGTMVPIELAVAEPNSGKTFLYNLRKGVYCGYPTLDSPPNDMRDWYAKISRTPFWVCDNMGDVAHDIKTRLSDEIARITTDPNPSISMRELYTTSSERVIPVNAAMAVTAVMNPFYKPDLMQRSTLFHMKAIPVGQRDSYWYKRELESRPEWLAEQMYVIMRFFRLARSPLWNQNYLSSNRLVNFEQSLLMMGLALGNTWGDMRDLLSRYAGSVQEQITMNDPTIQAIKEFADLMRLRGKARSSVVEIIQWASMDAENRFLTIHWLKNAILLNKFFEAHAYDIQEASGLVRFKEGGRHLLRFQ